MDGSDIVNLLYRLADEQNGRNVQIDWAGARYVVVQDIADADHIVRLNSANYEKALDWLSQVIGPSRLTENGEAWQSRQKLTQRHLAKCDPEHVFDLSRKHGQRGVKSMIEASQSGHDRIDDGLLRLITSGVMMEAVLNRSWESLGFSNFDNISHMLLYAVDYSFSTTGYNLGMDSARLPMDRERTLAFLEARRATMQGLSSVRATITPGDPVLWALLQNEKADPNFKLEHEMLVLLAAGSETSAAAIGWGCYLLAREPELQEELRDEIKTFWRSGTPSFTGLQRLDRFVNFVTEAMRIFPPTPVLGVTALGNDKLSDRTIEAGETVFVSIIGLNHSRKLRSDPWQICLEPRLPDHGRPPNMTFSAGPRVCGGRHFAVTEVLTVLAVILGEARLELTSPTPPSFRWCFSLNPKGGHAVRATSTN